MELFNVFCREYQYLIGEVIFVHSFVTSAEKKLTLSTFIPKLCLKLEQQA